MTSVTPSRGLALKAVVTLLLLGAVVWSIDLIRVAGRVSALDPLWLAAALATVFAAIAVSAAKWGYILSRRGHPLRFVRLVRHYLVGLFFNNLLPGSIGGDAVRAWETARDTGEVPEAVGSVVSERLLAGVALGLTAALGLPFTGGGAQFGWLVLVFLAINLAFVALFLLPKVAEGIVLRLLPTTVTSVGTTVLGIVTSVRQTTLTAAVVGPVLVASILFQVLVAAVNACIFAAMGLDVGLAACVILTPMIFTLTMIPVSLSGFGVREAAYVYFFAQVGVRPEDAVLASLAFFLIVGLASLPGAPLFLAARDAGTVARPPVWSVLKRWAVRAIDPAREAVKRCHNLLRGVRDISPRRAHDMHRAGALLLDVREPAEFDAAHVADSRLIPLRELAGRQGELAPYRDRPVVVLCHGGKRSATACAQLQRLGLRRTHNIAGGILAWQRAGLPVQRAAV